MISSDFPLPPSEKHRTTCQSVCGFTNNASPIPDFLLSAPLSFRKYPEKQNRHFPAAVDHRRLAYVALPVGRVRQLRHIVSHCLAAGCLGDGNRSSNFFYLEGGKQPRELLRHLDYPQRHSTTVCCGLAFRNNEKNKNTWKAAVLLVCYFFLYPQCSTVFSALHRF
eukprot:TRINITY_DN23189_c0_g1_i1.p1 TRINITY_DN23189_c0_g1~~TRINITY_DN23189_c0_g1_i1.p1  ORF type:complete len:166 (-),score=4.54 TRINITY_DN23189_c0_g1_i1:4-501(-)